MSRQNYYAVRRQRQRQAVDAELVVRLASGQRQLQPRLGVRKLRYLLRAELAEHGVTVGRDRFFGILRRAGMLVEPPRGRVRTTNSRHRLPVFRNLLASATVSGPNEAWVSDLTYIRTAEGYLYAALITDAYSRKIVGSDIDDCLEATGCLRALAQALGGLPAKRKPIHHSDRGCQYCCGDYVARLQERELPISMTETWHCYENALAERVNGILKQEYHLDCLFQTKAEARLAFAQAVWLYNHRRPHLKLNYRFPADVHQAVA
jgi:transposase InsO family protein